MRHGGPTGPPSNTPPPLPLHPPLPLAALRLYIRTFWLLTAKCGAIPAWGDLMWRKDIISCASHQCRIHHGNKKKKKVCDYDNVHAGMPVFHQRPSRLTLVLISGADSEAKCRILKRITQFLLDGAAAANIRAAGVFSFFYRNKTHH